MPSAETLSIHLLVCNLVLAITPYHCHKILHKNSSQKVENQAQVS
jgi:hypothetical protein